MDYYTDVQEQTISFTCGDPQSDSIGAEQHDKVQAALLPEEGARPPTRTCYSFLKLLPHGENTFIQPLEQLR